LIRFRRQNCFCNTTLSFAGLAGAMVFLVSRYHRLLIFLREDHASLEAVFHATRYLQVAFAVTGLITWETAVVVVPLVLNLSALWLIELLITKRPRVRSKCSLVPVAALR
jgi:hypothetical protein